MGASFVRRNFREDLAGQTAAAADVEDEGGGLQIEQLEGAVRHGGLDVFYAAGGGVFAGFGVVVVDVRRAGGVLEGVGDEGGEGGRGGDLQGVLWARHDGGCCGLWVVLGFGVVMRRDGCEAVAD